MFYSVNQRCYLTQVPYVISITLMIPKITKDFFSLHGLYEWCFKDVVCLLPSPHPSSPPSHFLSSPLSPPPSHLHSTHAPLLCVLLLHLCSDYSSIDSHADVAIGRYADPAVDTHKRQCRCLRGYGKLGSNVIGLSLCSVPKYSFSYHKNVKADIVVIYNTFSLIHFKM